jgi:D-alanyl-D-alanine carboxypeptidase
LISLFIFLNLIFCSKESTVQSEPTIAEQFQEALNYARENYNVSGVSAAVMIPGEEFWLGVSGVSHETFAISGNMVFCGGSVTKSFTSAVLLQLAEEGVLALEDSLHEWLPVFPNIDSTITIRQLLNHTGGVADYNDHPTIWSTIASDVTKYWTPEEIVTSFVLSPYCLPGTEFHYSNTGYILLGMIIEAATGSSASTQLRERLFIPLELDHTFLGNEANIPADFAHGWYDLDNNGLLDDVMNIPLTAFHSLTWTAGDIVCSPGDLAKWIKVLLEGEVINQSSLDQMLTFAFTPNNNMYDDYGLGMGKLGSFFVGNSQAFGHAGDWIGYASVMVYLPDHQVGFAIMSNEVNSDCLGSISNNFVAIIENHLSPE